MLSSLLAVIQNFTNDTKYIIETAHSIKFGIIIFDRVAMSIWSVHCSMALLTVSLNYDARFLSGWYAGKLFMECAYDADQQLLSLIFIVVVGELNVANWG
jgi:hypothetical protein